jgi:hypothetical protein
MKLMESEIESNAGIYSRNRGRVSLAEVCRRAGVHSITLMGPAHRDTTRITVMNWVSSVQGGNRSSRHAVKVKKIDRTVSLDASVKLLAAKLQALHQVEIPYRDEEIQRLKEEVELLKRENETLKDLVSSRNVVRLPPKKK